MAHTNDNPARRKPIATRIDSDALQTIEHLAEQRQTTPAQVARVWLEGCAKAFIESAAA